MKHQNGDAIGVDYWNNEIMFSRCGRYNCYAVANSPASWRYTTILKPHKHLTAAVPDISILV